MTTPRSVEHEHGPWIDSLERLGERTCRECKMVIRIEDCFHEWATFDPCGVIFGVTPCRRCGVIARGEDF